MKRLLPAPALALLLALLQGACSGSGSQNGPVSPVGPVPASSQRPGVPAAGYVALVDFNYIPCGVPYRLFQQLSSVLGPQTTLPGRSGLNANLPYFATAVTGETGIPVVTLNCLNCHAAFFDGKLVIGLGDSTGDYTQDPTPYALALGSMTKTLEERLEWQKWSERISAIGPYTTTSTVGVNPAENLSAAIFAHRDPRTLAWSHDPLMAPPLKQAPGLKVPPWWRVAKKNALYYDTSGRGDHAREMMTASSLCTDTIAQAEQIDSFFPDIEAYIESIQPPVWPWAIDQTKAAQGKTVFEATCSRCHGTYGPAGVYPNTVVDLPTIGSDPLLAQFETSGDWSRFTLWFNESFYGALGGLAPAPGYIAPPLDGVWATAPYLHNGSVPTIAAMLDSTTRPTYWMRQSFSSTDYDPVNLGWNYQTLSAGKAGQTDPNMKSLVYDTTLPGYSNQGHTFGDALSASDRAAVLEYLKTL